MSNEPEPSYILEASATSIHAALAKIAMQVDQFAAVRNGTVWTVSAVVPAGAKRYVKAPRS